MARVFRDTVSISLVWAALAAALPPPASRNEANGPQGQPANALRPWLSSLAEGHAQAQRLRQPLLVRFGTETCPWCRKLDEVIAQAPVQAELARWACVVLDADKSPRQTRALGVGGVPALRVLTPFGRLVASQDGYLPAEKLVAWLQKHYEAAALAPAGELTGDDAPDAAAVTRLVAELKAREPLLREAAIRRLLSHPDTAAPLVVETLGQGSLQSRLAALELLQTWKAPVAELDPWRPETLTEPRMKALHAWAAHVPKAAAREAEVAPPDELAAARQEIVRMLQGTEEAAAAGRERLARHGRALLPEVYAQLKAAGTDLARERLTALRYRLVATSALALDWPGGLERLAATSAAVRQQAAQELASRASPAEEPLLLELFGSPDPQVREISLRALQDIAGARATTALTQLLRDPEPNVRAAVLKLLAEQPTPGMVSKIVEYVAGEKDPDLLVHAVRVLRGTRTPASLACLKTLLEHESWRVRAEAAESLAKVLDRHTHDASQETKADICVALIRVLEDRDGFVVSRAIAGLRSADLAVAVDPLAAVAPKHPDLAAEVVGALAHGSTMRQKAVTHLRKFCTHAQPEVRAAAVAGLCQTVPDEAQDELRAALRDPSTTVRQAATAALFQILTSRRPPGPGLPAVIGDPFVPSNLLEGGGGAFEDAKPITPAAGGAAAAARGGNTTTQEVEDWVAKSRSAKGRPPWLAGMADLVRPGLTAEAPVERLQAALVLIALAQEDQALPVLLAAARAEPALAGKAAAALSWLPWPKRLQLFQQLLALRPGAEELGEIALAMVQARDPRALALVWQLADRADVTFDSADGLLGALKQGYLGASWYQPETLAPALRKEVIKIAEGQARAGTDLKRVLALALLASLSLADAGEAAKAVLVDPKASPALHRDAFQILLLTSSRSEARKAALATLAHKEAEVRGAAVTALAVGPEHLYSLRGGHLTVYVQNPLMNPDPFAATGQPFAPEAPKGLTAEMVRPLLRDADPRTAAGAGYLLVLLGDAGGLAPLLQYWRAHARADEEWTRLVVRALVAQGDDNQVRLLEEIYRGLPKDEPQRVREFYWTIRSLDGPNALRLRKQIRREVGMDNLR
jgi:HEAT repeat protein